MASVAKKGTKTVFKTTRPYTDTEWPSLTPVHRENILDLLRSLLQPLGDHRRTHKTPSKGKKRKREPNRDASADADKGPSEALPPPPPPPPPPEIGAHILIGLNSVTRHLEALAAQTAPSSSPSHTKKNEPLSGTALPRPITLVLVTHNHPPGSLPHAHIPTLIHLSTVRSQSEKATRLLAVPPNYENAIAEALHIPHVGALGILEGAPGADALVAYVRENVEITRSAWIDEAMSAEWKGVKIDTQQA